MTRGAARPWTVIGLFGQRRARVGLDYRRRTTSPSCRLTTSIALLRAGAFNGGRCVTFGGYFFALEDRTVVGPLEKIRFPIVRYLKLGDDLLAETGSSYVYCHGSNALAGCCRDFERVLDRLARIRYFEHLLAQHGVYYRFRLDLVRTDQHYIRQYPRWQFFVDGQFYGEGGQRPLKNYRWQSE